MLPNSWMPVEAVQIRYPYTLDATRQALLQHLGATITGDAFTVHARGGVPFYAEGTLYTDERGTCLRGMIRPRLTIWGTALIGLTVAKFAVVMSDPARLWWLSVVYWVGLVALTWRVLQMKQVLKQALLSLPAPQSETVALKTTPDEALLTG